MALFGQGSNIKETNNKKIQNKGNKQNKDENNNVPEFIKILAELNRRLRVLEERVDTLYDKVKVLNNTLSEHMKDQNEKIDKNESEINKINDDIKNIKMSIQRLFDLTKSLATKRDIKVLEKYIQILAPIKYLTKNELSNEEGE